MKKLVWLYLIVFIVGCKKKDPQPAVFDIPEKVTLIFPFENSACNEGTDVTDTESTVRFEWFSSEFTEEYELVVINLGNNEMTTMTTTEESIPVVLKRSAHYSWYVVSKNNSSDSTTLSETWKFYNVGDEVASYAPFPAEVISPAQAATLNSPGNITISWQGSDVDNDIVSYDIYFGTTKEPPLLAEDEPGSTIDVSVTTGNIYYWRIVTKDAVGHTSNSPIFQFKVM